tara:strand:+ start:58 stop:1470 length:1413 start_codon:yes stop_codon:yes gene_type:complete
MKIFKYFILFFIISFNISGQLLLSEYVEGSSYNKYIEIYNYSNESVNLYPDYVLASCTNGCVNGNNFYINEFPEGAVVAPGDVYVVAATQADQSILSQADFTFQYCCGNGDDAYALMLSCCTGDVFDSENALDIIGSEDTWEEGLGWDVAGVDEATKNHTLVRKGSVLTGNIGNWSMSAGTNADNSEWIVLEQDDFSNLGFHNYDNSGSTNVFGCTCMEADNYNAEANIDDGSCVVYGECSDPVALNYSGELCGLVQLSFEDEDCEYEVEFFSGCYWCDLAINYFDFNYEITASNMTLAITDFSNLINGDVVGVFYITDDGYIACGGSATFEGQQMAIAAWGDDPSTSFTDGFEGGDSFMFLVFRDDMVYETATVLNSTTPFTAIYGDNNFGQVTEFSITNEFIENCELPLGVSEDCSQFFDISEHESNEKEVIISYDFLGRNVNCLNKSGLYLVKYNDGSVEKKYFSNH